MNNVLNKIRRKLLYREQIFESLCQMIGDSKETFPPAIYINGHSGTGKTTLAKEFVNHSLHFSSIKAVFLDCIECYTSKILYENILDGFYSQELKKYSDTSNFRCDNLNEFISGLRKIETDTSYVIVLDNAERVRDMEPNILPSFLRLPELTGLNICCVLISQLTFEKYYTKTGLSEIISIYCSPYNKNEILGILMQDFSAVQMFVLKQLEKKAATSNVENFAEQRKYFNQLSPAFYSNYLNLFLSVFHQACRYVPELKIVSKNCFVVYVEPVLNGVVESNDVSRLWRHIANPFRIAMSQLYMRTDRSNELPTGGNLTADHHVKNLSELLELPYYAKYLLIAAFLASHNSAKEDKRLFMKHHGKQRKRMQTVNAKAKLSEKLSTSLGPKSFSIDRLLAIFYAILEDKVGLTCNLLAQIATLVHLKLLCYVSGENNVMEGSARLQCTVGLEFIVYIGKVVDFNIRQYLCDLM